MNMPGDAKRGPSVLVGILNPCPKVKLAYRHAEHALQNGRSGGHCRQPEETGYNYPVQPLYHAWLEMLLNMDRNTLWGTARRRGLRASPLMGRVRAFRVGRSDLRQSADRRRAQQSSAKNDARGSSTHSTGTAATRCCSCFRRARGQPARDAKRSPTPEPLPVAAAFPGNRKLGTGDATAESAKLVAVPAVIETKHYWAKIDPATGALDSLKTKPSGREVLSGPVLLVAESGLDAHDTPERPQRKRLADSPVPGRSPGRGRSVGDRGVGRSQYYGGGKSSQTIPTSTRTRPGSTSTRKSMTSQIRRSLSWSSRWPRNIRGTRRGMPTDSLTANGRCPTPSLRVGRTTSRPRSAGRITSLPTAAGHPGPRASRTGTQRQDARPLPAERLGQLFRRSVRLA